MPLPPKPGAKNVSGAWEVRSVTQEELAKNIGIEQGTLSKIEKGILPADQQIIKSISKSLDFPETFFTRKYLRQPGFAQVLP